MKVIKYIAQILAAIIYSPIYTGIMYFAIVLPTIWVITLSFWKMLLVFIFLGGLIEGLITLLQIFGMLPFVWITKDNRVSLVVSIIICVLLPLYNIYFIWRSLYGQGAWAVVIAIILSLMLLQFIYVTVGGLLGFNEKE